MRIVVLNRDQIESERTYSVYSDNTHVIISISSPKDRATLKPTGMCLGILWLEFYDLDRPIKGYPQVFNVKQAKEIVKFFNQYKDKVEYVIIHCDAGISRSPAVAAALTKATGGLDTGYFQNYLPNRRVYSILLSEFLKQGEEKNDTGRKSSKSHARL